MERQIFKDGITEYLKKYGQGSTWNLAKFCGTTTPKARTLMKKLKSDGYVQLCERYTSVNNLVWVLTYKAKGGE